MSIERDVINTTKKPVISIKDLPPEQRRARIATILDRGTVGVRLHVDLPPDVHGEWVANDPESIFRMETLGFEIDTEFARQRALHNDGTDKAIVGDVIFMTTSKENKMEIEEVRRLKYAETNNKKTGLPEENSVTGQIAASGLPVTNMSTQERVNTQEISQSISQP